MNTIFTIHSPFFLPPFLRREEKREKNNQRRGQKSCLSARSKERYGINIVREIEINQPKNGGSQCVTFITYVIVLSILFPLQIKRGRKGKGQYKGDTSLFTQRTFYLRFKYESSRNTIDILFSENLSLAKKRFQRNLHIFKKI